MRRLRFLVLCVCLSLVVPGVAAAAPGGSDAAQAKIELLADFAAGAEADEAARAGAVDTVTELRAGGVGWGALFHLLKLSAALDVEPGDLVPGPDGEPGFGFGKLRKSLTADQLDAYLGSAKNFGQLKKAAKAPKAKG